MSSNVDLNIRPGYDSVISEIANYVCNFEIESDLALDTARNCLIDTIGCGLLALKFPACTKMLGPVVEGTSVPFGVRVPGTNFKLDPIKGAFDIGCIIRWLDYNDTWLAAEWGHPSDNLGGILAVADYISQKNISEGKDPLTMRVVLESMIMAHEIQGILALKNSFNKVGLDHVVLVKVASTALVTKLMGGTSDQIMDWNGLKTTNIYTGQHLRIETEKKVTPPKPKPKPVSTRKYYSVRSGDTFGHIAEKNRVSQSRLKKLNPRININRLSIGQKIRIR